MNIFILSTDPVDAAQMQCDKHVVKMILETAQILSTCFGGPYKPTHVNHPCTVWARESRGNAEWLRRHGLALCTEYTYRYGKRHKCQYVIEQIIIPTCLPHGITPFVQCMPDEFKCDDPVEAYRAYYHSKASFAKWAKREQPTWWKL